IPARTVHGLVAAELGDTPALYWHQWAQVWVGEWLDVDPTFGQEVADATHLALGQEGSTKALSVMGRLRVHEAAGRRHSDPPRATFHRPVRGPWGRATPTRGPTRRAPVSERMPRWTPRSPVSTTWRSPSRISTPPLPSTATSSA